MFSHDPLTEETRELLDKVMPRGDDAIADGNQKVPLPLTWYCSPPGWPQCGTSIPNCNDLEEMDVVLFCRGR